MRAFEPVKLAGLECDAWVAYYRRRWVRFLLAAVKMVRTGFGMSWARTIRGAWHVLRANQRWASYPQNDADGARTAMRRFYALVSAAHGEDFDVEEAARLEVDWWREHRHLQRETPDGDPDLEPLVAALTALYAHVYRVDRGAVRAAARYRALAMVSSDEWVAQGRDPASPLIAEERAALVRSYAALLLAVHRPAP
jgi:hypothetical protein